MQSQDPCEVQKGWEQFLSMSEPKKEEIYQYYYQHNHPVESSQNTPNTNVSLTMPIAEIAKAIRHYLISKQQAPTHFNATAPH
jgi:hypothetical protein